jgi:hypothetical protein
VLGAGVDIGRVGKMEDGPGDGDTCDLGGTSTAGGCWGRGVGRAVLRLEPEGGVGEEGAE